jgi:glycosyltransferase involved in cell wall biosynthesis
MTGRGPAAERTLNVLHVITGLGSGGAESVLYRLAAAPAPGIARQTVISLTDSGFYGEALETAGVPLTCLNMAGPASIPSATLRCATVMRRERPDVVVTWLYHADLIGTLAAVLAGQPPLLWNLRCSDIDFSKIANTTRWTVGLLARLSRWPWGVAANSEAGQRVHAALGYRPQRWLILPNGFDTTMWRPDCADRAAVRAEWGAGPDTVVVGCVARADPQKDHAGLFKAMAELPSGVPDVRLVLIGRGTEDLVPPLLPQGQVLALGERRDVARLLRGFDIAVLPSIGEGMPNVVGEAMASAVPCVVSDVGDAARLVGDTGRVVPPRNAAALAAALSELITVGHDVRARLGASARHRIETAWSDATMRDAHHAAWRAAAARAATASHQTDDTHKPTDARA